MEYLGIVIVVILVGLLGYVRFKNRGKTSTAQLGLTSEELGITIDPIQIDYIKDEKRLVEIKDPEILGKIDHLIPGLINASVNIKNINQAAELGNWLYKVTLPKGVELVKSRQVEGAFRGFYRGSKHISGHANFKPVDINQSNIAFSNSVAFGMNVASMVVGQYYMSEINKNLGHINDNLDQVQDFQDNEYRSKVMSLLAHVKKMTDFKTEIIENKELRLSKINQLDHLEVECTQLLGQASLMLESFTNKTNLKYESYEKTIEKIQSWLVYQGSLLEMLNRMADLRYALHLGAVSRKQCTALLPTYKKQVVNSQTKLASWHTNLIEQLHIEPSQLRRERIGIEGVTFLIPSLFKGDLKFKSIDEKTAKLIVSQSSRQNFSYQKDTSELYDEDVQLIAKNGKVYYLPQERNKS